MPESTNPPKGAHLLLSLFRSEPDLPQIEGDLSEEFHQHLLASGPHTARRWYWREVFRNLWVFTKRPRSIQVFAVGALCVAIFRFAPPLSMGLMRNKLSLMPRGLLLVLFQVAFGLALGVLMSLMLRGRESLLRLTFAGFSAIWLAHTIGYWLQHSTMAGSFTLSLRDLFWPGQLFSRFFCAVIVFWIGSLWMEWRRRQPAAV